MEIKVNVINEIKKIRGGVVYSSVETVLDELLQNCQRAGAKNITVEMEDNAITIIDDGVGTDDLEKVFDKSTTGWGNNDEAFGEGFFSTFSIADTIEVESRGKRLFVDVNHMLEEEDLTLKEEDSDFKDGFKVRIEGEVIKENYWKLERHFKSAGSILEQHLKINDTTVEKKGLLDKVNGDYAMEFDNDFYTGKMGISDSFSDSILYYEKRKVKDLWISGIFGILELKKDAVTLKAPDRKDLIRDGKYQAYRSQLDEDIASVFKKFVSIASDREISNVAHRINDRLEVEDYLDYLKIDLDMWGAIKKPAGDREEESSTGTSTSTNTASPTLEDTAHEEREDRTVGSSVATTVYSDTKKALKESLDQIENPAFYFPDDKKETELARELEYLGYTVIKCPNVLYEKAFKYLGIKNVTNISMNASKEHGIKNDKLLNEKEKRFFKILKRVEDLFDLPSTFRICDIDAKIVTKVEGEEKESKSIDAQGFQRGNEIYLDRKYMGLDMLEVGSDKITLRDMKVFIYNIDTIAHELAHLIYGTVDNSKEHSNKQAIISRELHGIL